MLRRIVPYPLLTLLLIVVWQMLVNAVSVGSLVLGTLLALVIPLVTAPYWPDRAGVSSLPRIVDYVLVVLWDIVLGNIHVAQVVLFKSNANTYPAWISIPLDLRRPEAITVLAGTITLTPGTVSSDLSADGRSLLVHCLDAPDPDAVRDTIKTRYEARLKEIFE